VAALDYLAGHGVPRAPQDLAGHRVIACTAAAAQDRWRFGPGAAREVPVTPVFITNSIEAAIWHARNGGGLTQVMSYQVADEVRAGRLRLVLVEHEPAPLPIQFVYPSSRLLSVKVRALIDQARETCDWSFVDL
jgi:DNA-binding transcriptional LysR family regulator